MFTNLAVRAFLFQAMAIVLVVAAGAAMVLNLQEALDERNIATGFSFLGSPAGFAIGEGLIPFQSEDAFWRAYAVGIVNTLYVSAVAIVAATIIGVALGFMRLSLNPLVSAVARIYIEFFRNTPQLVQIIFWYALVTRLPHPREALSPMEGVLLTNRGVYLPAPADRDAFAVVILALLVGLIAAFVAAKWAERRRLATGVRRRLWPMLLALALGPPIVAFIVMGAPVAVETPALSGFRVVGGVSLSPEFLALALGLSLYIAAFIAEIVRAGIMAVPKGQVETARALGLKPFHIHRFVVLPQALRVIVPPAAAQYVSLVKNSSLGVAIGFPELFNVNNTILTLSGHVLEAMAILMAVYLTISLGVSALMNAYNRSIAFKER